MHNKDGINHINIYSKGKTELGRHLSNFTYDPFTCEDGYFTSIEGYWYWLLSNSFNKEKLRNLYGYQAKKFGKSITIKDWPEENEIKIFKNKIIKAFNIRVNNSLYFRVLLKQPKYVKLPFKHYYVYGDKIRKVKNCEWILEAWEDIRKQNL